MTIYILKYNIVPIPAIHICIVHSFTFFTFDIAILFDIYIL